MRPGRVVILLPNANDAFRMAQKVKLVDTETFVPEPADEGSDEPVSPGLLWLDKHQVPFDSPFVNGFRDEYGRINTGPLSMRSAPGIPRSMAWTSSWSMRSSAVIEYSTFPPNASLVCSSTKESILNGFPAMVESNWKSFAHKSPGLSAWVMVGRSGTPTHFWRCLTTTRRPSSPHKRWILL